MASFEEIQVADADDPRREGLPPGIGPALMGLLGVLVVGAAPYLLDAEDCIEFGGDEAGQDLNAPGEAEVEPKRLCAGDVQVWVEGDSPPFAGHFNPETVLPFTKHTKREQREKAEFDAVASGTRTKMKLEPVAPKVSPKDGHPAGPSAKTEVKRPPTFKELAKSILIPDDWHSTCESLDPPRGCVPPGTKIDDPGDAMTAFYRSLAQTAIDTLREHKTGRVTRISHWGDSAIVADGMTSAIRRLMQDSFGDAGHGFVLIDGGKSYAHQGVIHRSKGWHRIPVINRRDKLRRYGFGGISVKGYAGAWGRFGTVDEGPVGTKVGRFDLYYMSGPDRGTVSLRVDGGAARLVDTSSETISDKVYSFKVDDGDHQLILRAKGAVRLYGVVLERELPGVVYDSLGLLGARGSRLLDFDDDHLKAQFAARDVGLIVLMFGGNELIDRTSLGTYRATFEAMVKKFRQASPASSCLIMSPVDHAERHRGRHRTVPRLLEIMPVQREVAHEQGCAYFSNFEAMGGDGSIAAWVKRSPPLAYADYSHLRPAGGELLGLRVYKALVYGFAQYLESL